MRNFTILLGLAILAACTPTQQEEAPKGPLNILFIMSDDHAEQAISCYGNDLVQTPNIDRIAREGIRFSNSFVTNSICAPSRAVLLTGKYSHLNGLRDNRDRFDGSQLTFPKLLQQAGYQTAMVGKWHLKTAPTGFDYWHILMGQGPYYNPRMLENGDTIQHTGYTTDIITDLALKFLSERDSTKPFCMLYHHKAPHRNWKPHPRYFDMYKDQEIPLPETFWDDYATRSAAAREQDMRVEHMFLTHDSKLLPEDYGGGKDPGTGGSGNTGYDAGPRYVNELSRFTPEQRAAWDAHYDEIRREFRESNLSGKALTEWKYQRYMKDYLRCVKAVDDNIGRVLAQLEKEGILDNTLIVYTSDQGFYLGEHGWFDKRFMYEESLSMPLVMRLPSAIPAGQVSESMVLNLDFAPTLLDFAGVQAPPEMQGTSLRPLLSGKTPEDWRKSMYYEYFEYPHGWHFVKQHYGVRTDRYKLIHFHNDIDAWELYDLQTDPNELNNLYEDPAQADLIAELKTELGRLREEMKVE